MTRDSSPGARVYALRLRAYPARVRARFADGMTYAFGHELDEARENGVRTLLAFWVTTILTTVWFGFSARFDRVPHVDPAEAYGDLRTRRPPSRQGFGQPSSANSACSAANRS